MSDSPQRPADRLREARQRSGFDSAADFAKAYDLPETTYRSHENGNRPLTVAAAKQYAKHLQTHLPEITWLYLMEGTEPSREPEAEAPRFARRAPPPRIDLASRHQAPFDPAGLPRDVPVYVGALCGENEAFAFQAQEIIDYAPRPPRLTGVRAAYALYTQGDSMSPWREQGQLVYVYPGMPVRPNDYVVVQLKPPGENEPLPSYIKRLIGQSTKEVTLLQYSPRKHLIFPMQRVHLIHRVMDWPELLGT